MSVEFWIYVQLMRIDQSFSLTQIVSLSLLAIVLDIPPARTSQTVPDNSDKTIWSNNANLHSVLFIAYAVTLNIVNKTF